MMQGSLARKLRILRAERGLTQERAAGVIGITPETLSDLERGKRRAYGPTLSKIAKGYGISVEELLEEPVPLAEASQEMRRLEDKWPEAEPPQDPLQWERVLASVLDRQREVEAKVEELIALGVGEADPYEVKWALEEAEDCWHTLMLALPGGGREGNRIVVKANLFSIAPGQWEQRVNAERFYYDLLERLVEAGLVEWKERTGQRAEPVPVGIGA
jgi:transcriptional regulator with XRE-family HTH domain